MNLIKKVLIVLVIILFTYIVWRLLKTRIEIKKQSEEKEGFSLFSSASDNEFASLKTSDNVLIENCKPDIMALPLREYCIKASYNTALTGNYVNTDMITYILNRGCRFIDFEIFYIGETIVNDKNETITKYTPRVAYSTDNTFTTINTENSLLLDEVLTSVMNSAFSAPTPNNKDPLFINLRIKSNNKEVYKAVATSIDNTIRQKIYVDTKKSQTPYPAVQINNKTLLSDIMGKIIICMDKTIERHYKDYTHCDAKDQTCYDLTDYINVETGSNELNLLRYSEVMEQCTIPITINNDNMRTTIKTMKYVVPNTKYDNSKNPDISDFILKYSAQIPAYRFYRKDKDLELYEQFFNDNHSAFVPLAIAITYFKNMQG
jgi:type II secretory pathway pseudopilin PulG